MGLRGKNSQRPSAAKKRRPRQSHWTASNDFSKAEMGDSAMTPISDYLIPVGAEATATLGKCADSWTDSEIAVLRMKLPVEYHAWPLDDLRRRWINIRKAGTPGYRLRGTGPRVGSRLRLALVPKEYHNYLQGDDWKRRRKQWLEFWCYRCCVCNSPESPNVHHRTYERVGHELRADCVVLCRSCHELFESDRIDRGSSLFAVSQSKSISSGD